MRKSKRIKALEAKTKELEMTLHILLNLIQNEPIKIDLENGKWYTPSKEQK